MRIVITTFIMVIKGETEPIDRFQGAGIDQAIEYFAARKALDPEALLSIYDVIPLEAQKSTQEI